MKKLANSFMANALMALFCFLIIHRSNAQTVVNFAVDVSQYADGYNYTNVNVAGEFNSWCDICTPLSDPDGDSIWTGSITTSLSSFEYKYLMDTWGGDSENFSGPCVVNGNRYADLSGEEDTVDLGPVCWESCSACVIPTSKVVNFAVDMNQYNDGYSYTNVNVAGEFNSWCDICTPLSDPDGDNIWTGSITTMLQTMEYKFVLDSWGGDNEIFGGPCIVNGNRYADLSGGDTIDLGPFCWESCIECVTPVDMTFIVDMSQVDSLAASVHIVGPFNNFDPAATPMNPLGDGKYSVTIQDLQPGSQINFKYLNGPSFNNAEFVSSGPCAANNGFGDRTLLIPTTDQTVGPDCFGLCGPCPPRPCKSPKNLVSTHVSPTMEQLSWAASANANNYVIRGNQVGASSYVYVQSSSTSTKVSGLSPGKSYFWQVQAICSGNTAHPVSAFSTKDTFMMLPCASPTGVATVDVNENSATLQWDGVPGAIEYRIRGRVAGTNSYAHITIGTNSFIAKGLTPSTTYEWTVKVVCANGVPSDPSSPQVFTTAGLDKRSEGLSPSVALMNLHPNPAQDQFVLTLNSEAEGNKQLDIYDLQGKLVFQQELLNDFANNWLIDIPNELENGVYQLIVKSNDVIFKDKIVIIR